MQLRGWQRAWTTGSSIQPHLPSPEPYDSLPASSGPFKAESQHAARLRALMSLCRRRLGVLTRRPSSTAYCHETWSELSASLPQLLPL